MARNTLAPGGYVGGEPPRRPYFNQLSGVWKLEDVLDRKKADTWANPTSIEDLFSTYLYTGNGSTQTITNGIDLAANEGLVWIKRRDNISAHCLYDTIRGAGKRVETNTTDAEKTTNNNLSSFNSNGFTTLQGADTNGLGNPYTSWTFRTAPKFFDVVTYTGTGVARTIAHNLGSVPGCIIVKKTDSPDSWRVYHRSLAASEYLTLSANEAKFTDTTLWNNTAPTSTVFSVGTAVEANANGGKYVAYLFAHDAGGFGDSGNDSIIKCGSYVGSTTVDLGFEPQLVIVKQAIGGTGNWYMFDSMRGMLADNSSSAALEANTASAESVSNYGFSINATGFSTTGIVGVSGRTYIYIAIRRGPMKAPTDATKVFKAVTQTSQGTVSTDFPVDMVIMGDRSSTWGYNWSAQDRLRGKTAVLFTSGTGAENTTSLSTFDSNTSFKDGWVSGGTSAIYETFRRAPGFFDVVAYTGDGTNNRNVPHNLRVTPELVIYKKRSAAASWFVTHSLFSVNEYLLLQGPGAKNTFSNTFGTPTSTNLVVSSAPNCVNDSSATYIAYLFASCPGVSKVGSYTGTGTTLDVDCGFTNGARFVLIKRTDSTGDWYVWDTARGIVSGNDPSLLLNSTAAEVTNTDYIDPLNAGFQISSTAPAAINANGGSFIFLAIA